MTAAAMSGARLPRRVAALLEQGLVSAANFLAFILLARSLPAEAWGGFGLAYATVLFAQGVQRALVTIPMIPFSATGPGWAGARGGWAGANTALALAAGGVLGAAAIAVALLQGGWLAPALGAAAAMAVPMMAHEFCRRAAIQEGRLDLLATTGAAYAVALLAAAAAPWPAAWPVWPGAQAALAVGLASTAAVLTYRLGAMLPVLAMPCRPPAQAGYGSFGGWALASHLAYSGYNYGVQVLLGALAGPAALGAFHACRTLVQPVSTLQAAMDGIDKPLAAEALATQGMPGLRRVLRRATAVSALLALPYLALVAFGAGPLLGWLYGPLYAGQEAVVAMWCLAALCSVVSQPVESGLYVTRRTRALFAARASAATASLLLAPWLALAHGASGALAAVALGFALAAGLGLLQLNRPSTAP